MDQIAVISDIHSNLPALQAVMADINARGIERIYCLGDLAGKGPDSCEVVDLCRHVCKGVVRGNWDEHLVAPDAHGSENGKRHVESSHMAWQRDLLGSERLAYLDSLPNVIDFWLSGKAVRLFHASQQSVHHRVLHRDAPGKQRTMFENSPFTGFSNVEPDIVGYGDIHHAYSLPVDDKVLFNVGSVGNPMDFLPLAGYAILRGSIDTTLPGPFSIEIVRLPYDIETALARARAVDMPRYEAYEFELRTANHRSQMG